MKKEGQVFAQPFIIIFALIVAVLTIAWGVKIILDLKERAEYTELTTTIADIRDDVRTYYYLEQGSSKLLNYIVPQNTKCICFKDQTNTFPGAYTPVDEICDPKNIGDLRDLTLNENVDNVFVTPLGTYGRLKQSFNVEKETLVPFGKNPLCIRISNQRFRAVIQNRGTNVAISRYCKGEGGTCSSGTCSLGGDTLDCINSP